MEKYKFYSTSKLRTILDDNRPDDIRAENTIRAILLARYKRTNEVQNVSIKDTDEDYSGESHFSHGGCDICSHGLGNDVYDTHGYSAKRKEVLELGQVCHACICVEYNGVD